MSSDLTQPRKRKKDFKLRQDILADFEKYAPAGRQTAVIEQLLAAWVARQKTAEQDEQMRRIYAKQRRKKA